MNFLQSFISYFKEITYIRDEIDTESASVRIKSNIWFRGPNVWILAFAIVLASVGLNVNSTAVIIGAMLISPLMGPIIGIGLAMGTNDIPLLKSAAKNLLVMIVISLIASCLFFLISPLEMANPTELEARTSPTIYDVLIALFGGLAGILENSRKERGTVLSGVAIATALMPPLCTAGYGIANGSVHFFLGASFLFLINCVFIVLSTYVMVKYLGFKEVDYVSKSQQKKTRTAMAAIIVLIIVPSIISAVRVVSDNNFQISVQHFVAANKNVGKSYIYDYKVHSGRHRCADVYFAGKGLNEEELNQLYIAAENAGIERDRLHIMEHSMGGRDEETDQLINSIYKHADEELAVLNGRIRELEQQLEEEKAKSLPYSQIAKEIKYNNPQVSSVELGRGAAVSDSLDVRECVSVILKSASAIPQNQVVKIQDWLKLRLDDSTVVVHSIVERP